MAEAADNEFQTLADALGWNFRNAQHLGAEVLTVNKRRHPVVITVTDEYRQAFASQYQQGDLVTLAEAANLFHVIGLAGCAEDQRAGFQAGFAAADDQRVAVERMLKRRVAIDGVLDQLAHGLGDAPLAHVVAGKRE